MTTTSYDATRTMTALVVVFVLVLATTGQYAFGDSIVDDIVVNPQRKAVAFGGAIFSVQYKVVDSSGPANSCEASDGTSVTVIPAVPVGVDITFSPASRTFSACESFQSFTYTVGSGVISDVYDVSVSASDADGHNYNVNSARFDLLVKPPTPTLSTPTNGATISDSTPELTWLAVDGTKIDSPYNYILEIDDDTGTNADGSFDSPLVTNSPTSAQTAFTSSSLADGTYYWHMRVQQGGFNLGDWSSTFSFVISSDTIKPTVVSVTPSPALINDETATPGDNEFTLTIVFSEDMKATPKPTVTFPVEDPSSTITLDAAASTWTDIRTFVVTYDVTDNGQELTDVDVGVSGAQDLFSNTMDADTATGDDNFDIDTKNPTVSSIAVDNNPITDSDDGNTLKVEVTFSEAMKTSAIPSITFSPDVSSTLASAGIGTWGSFDTVYEETFNVSDAGVTVAEVDVNVGGARDVVGNLQSPEPTILDNNLFAIDTENPTVTDVTVTPTLVNEAAVASPGTLSVKVTFSEAMDDGVDPSIGFDPSSVSSTVGTSPASDSWNLAKTEYTAVYTLADTDQEVDDVDVTVANAKDAAGNTMSADLTTGADAFDIDTKAPTVVATPNRTLPDHNGWVNVEFTVDWSSSDSDVVDTDCDPDETYSGPDGTGKTLDGSCTDDAGNVGTGTYGPFDFDDTAPTGVSGAPNRIPDNNGWYNAPVDIVFTGTDATSLIDECTTTNYTGPDGTALTVMGSCTDNAGNTSPDVSSSAFDFDDTNPTNILFVGGPAAGANYYFGSVPFAPTCTADDVTSLPTSCNVTGYSDLVGGHTMTATAEDKAGNTATATRSYTVLAWTINGFYQPIDMNGIENVAKAGKVVPVKYSLFAGPTELTNTDTFKSLNWAPSILCGNAPAADDVEQYASDTGNTELRYDPTAHQFVKNVKVPTKLGCWTLTLTTDDGSSIFAIFWVKK